MFSKQFMIDPAIECFENSLAYCKIEQTSPQGIPNTLFRIGKQYDKKNDIERASLYYEQAIEGMMRNDNLLYRDIVSSKALCDYQLGVEATEVVSRLRKIVASAETEEERLNRFLTIGTIFKAEQAYDSALYYFVPVFQNEANIVSKTLAAESMRVIYDNIGDRGKADECMRFLIENKKSDGENKVLVSALEELFQTYMVQKKAKEADNSQKTMMHRLLGIIIPAVFVIAMCIAVFAKLRSKKLLKEQQDEVDRKLGETEQQYRMERAAMSGRLKKSNEALRELKDQVKYLDDLDAAPKQAGSFMEEPICRLILDRVREGRFKSKIDYVIYKDTALNKQQLLDLRLAANRHFGQFTVRLKKAYPELTNGDLDYCCLYLLGLSDADVAALMQRAYNTVIERSCKIRKVFGNKDSLHVTLMGMAKGYLSV